MFSDNAVKRIIRNPAYLGYACWCEGGMQGNHNKEGVIKRRTIPQLIDDELWNKANERLNTLEKLYANRKHKVKHEHWLRGLIRCDNCGELIVKNGDFFQCTGYTHGRCKISHSIKVYMVEEAILNELKNTFKNKPINIKISESSADNVNEIDLLKEQLKQINLKENRIKLAYENGIDTLDEYKENKLRLKKEKEKLQELINSKSVKDFEEEKRNKIFERCKDAYDILKDSSISVEDKSIITHALFEKIVFVKETRELLVYYK